MNSYRCRNRRNSLFSEFFLCSFRSMYASNYCPANVAPHRLVLIRSQCLDAFSSVTYQLADRSANRLFNEPILAYFWNIIGWGSVIRLRNNSERWAEIKYAQYKFVESPFRFIKRWAIWTAPFFVMLQQLITITQPRTKSVNI